jgi:cell division protein FtsA
METATSDFVVGLDVGTSRTRCFVAETADGDAHIIGRGEEPSRGVRRGEVIDLAAASYSVSRAVRAAEEQADVEIQTFFLSVGSRHVNYVNNRACVGITREERTVTARDVHNVLASARQVAARDAAEQIGSLVCSYAVDDVRHVRDPVGMHGTRLEAEVHLITDARTVTENIASCAGQNRYEVEDYVFAPYAAAEAVLEEDERRLGVALVDIGAGTTRIILYRDDAPVFSSVVPVGGDHLTSDVAVGMNLGLADAERLKEQYAAVGQARMSRAVTFSRLASGSTYSVDPRRLRVVVRCRAGEILDIVRRELVRAGVRPASVRAVLTGGTSRLPGLDSLAATTLGCSVRVGRPQFDGQTFGPEAATAIGLLHVGMAARKRHALPVSSAGPTGRLLGWLRQLF